MFTKALFNKCCRLKDREKGRDAFVLANGPSIVSEDLSSLRGKLVIGMNASTMLEEQFGFVQSYYCVSDARFLAHEEKRRWATNCISSETVRVVRKDIARYDDSALSDRTMYVPHIKRDGFSTNLEVGFYYGCTTTMLAVQLAYFLGCENIYLLGVDLRYAKGAPRFYTEAAPQLEDAFASVQIWNLANAAKELSEMGRTLVNMSSRSLLRPYLPYRPFPEVVGKSDHIPGKPQKLVNENQCGA